VGVSGSGGPVVFGATYKCRDKNKRATTTAKSARTPRTRAVFLPKAHSAASANLLALALVLSKSALISCQSFPCSLSYANLATFLCLKVRCSQCSKGDEPTMIGERLLPYSPNLVEEEFSEVRSINLPLTGEP
jgi:hypothetical protein